MTAHEAPATHEAPVTRRDARGALRTAGRHDRMRRQRRGMLVATLGVLGTTLLGVSAAGGTYAYLNATDTSKGGTIAAGSASLLVNGQATSALAGITLDPGTENRIPVKVRNTGSVPLQLTATVAVTNTTVPDIARSARALVVAADAAGTCPAGAAGTRGAIVPTYQSGVLGTIPADNADKTYCLMIGLPAGTSASQSGQSFTYRLTVNGRQTAP